MGKESAFIMQVSPTSNAAILAFTRISSFGFYIYKFNQNKVKKGTVGRYH
jgi:hypothetical protein